jgi:hypothetical protein
MVQFNPALPWSRIMRILSLVTLFVVTASSVAAPGDQPKWEYAELSYRSIAARPGVVGPDGNDRPATPASAAIRWLSGAEEMALKSWTEMAEKLKVTGFKKDGSAALQKIQILNYLGSEGWELMEQQDNATTTGFARAGTATNHTWLFKRRVR